VSVPSQRACQCMSMPRLSACCRPMKQTMEQDIRGDTGGCDCASVLCWFCPRLFFSQPARTHHMSVLHPRRNRLVPPPVVFELHEGAATSEQHRAAASVVLYSISGSRSSVLPSRRPSGASPPRAPPWSPCPTPTPGGDEKQPLLGGLGVVLLPVVRLVHGSLASPRRRHMFHTSTAARIWAYYESLPEAGTTRPLVPPSVGQQPSVFKTPLLREVLKFTMGDGGRGLTETDQMAYLSVLLMTEQEGRARRPFGRRRVPRPRQEHALAVGARANHHPRADDLSDRDSSDDGELARAFPTRNFFVDIVRRVQR